MYNRSPFKRSFYRTIFIHGEINRPLNGIFRNILAFYNKFNEDIGEFLRVFIRLFAFHRKRDPFDANDDGFSEQALIRNSTFGARLFQRLSNRGKLTADYFNINEFRRGGNNFDLPLHEADIAESAGHGINTGALNFDLLFREADKLSLFASSQWIDRSSYYGAEKDLSAYGQTNDITFSYCP